MGSQPSLTTPLPLLSGRLRRTSSPMRALARVADDEADLLGTSHRFSCDQEPHAYSVDLMLVDMMRKWVSSFFSFFFIERERERKKNSLTDISSLKVGSTWVDINSFVPLTALSTFRQVGFSTPEALPLQTGSCKNELAIY